ncbi:Dom-3 Z [Globomyces sp. JEL0801]|nr:Dom-3 Z [Globomyces sp. JEL0801]
MFKKLETSNSTFVSFVCPRINDLKYPSKYSKPEELTHFSYDKTRELHLNSTKSLNIFNDRPLPIDLNTGYPNKFIERDPKPEHIDALLKSIEDIQTNPQFCTWRGIFTKIITTPYCPRDDWQLGATLYNGTIYLEEHESIDKINSKFGSNESHKLFMYYGYKFEEEFTKPFGHDSSDDVGIVNTNVQYCSVFKSKLGTHEVVLGGEVDCILRPPKDNEQISSLYAELKTHRVIETPQQKNSFHRFKLLKTWAQSYLAGVPNIIFGFRDDVGTLQSIKHWKTDDLPRIAKSENLWDRHVCLNFGTKVLDFLKQNITVDDKNVVYTIKYDSRQREISIYGSGEDSELKFVRDWYRNTN